MKQRTSANKPGYKAEIADNYRSNQNVFFEIQGKEKCFTLSITAKKFSFWQQTDHKCVCDFFFLMDVMTLKFNIPKMTKLMREGEQLSGSKASLIKSSAAKQKKGSHG